jgi:hypothetical protein
MKTTTFFAALIALCTAASAPAAPAVPGTLADYLALGSGGATIGTTLFSDFKLELNQGGATQIPTSILVTPINLLGAPALEFSVQQTALAGELFELKLSYKVQDLSIFGAEFTLNTASATGDAAVTGSLDLTGPTPQPPTLIAFATSGASGFSDQGTFPSVGQLFATADFVVDGGGAGQGSAGSFTNRYQVAAVPEPSTAMYGLATFAVFALRRFRRPV